MNLNQGCDWILITNKIQISNDKDFWQLLNDLAIDIYHPRSGWPNKNLKFVKTFRYFKIGLYFFIKNTLKSFDNLVQKQFSSIFCDTIIRFNIAIVC